MCYFLVGNKTDLESEYFIFEILLTLNRREVKTEEGLAYAKANGL